MIHVADQAPSQSKLRQLPLVCHQGGFFHNLAKKQQEMGAQDLQTMNQRMSAAPGERRGSEAVEQPGGTNRRASPDGLPSE